jgi:hypothetical protein
VCHIMLFGGKGSKDWNCVLCIQLFPLDFFLKKIYVAVEVYIFRILATNNSLINSFMFTGVSEKFSLALVYFLHLEGQLV